MGCQWKSCRKTRGEPASSFLSPSPGCCRFSLHGTGHGAALARIAASTGRT